MKIKREIGGIEYEFELTKAEMNTAYWEQKEAFAREYVKYYTETFLEENEEVTEADIQDCFDDIVERYLELEGMKDNWDSLEEAFDWVLI